MNKFTKFVFVGVLAAFALVGVASKASAAYVHAGGLLKKGSSGAQVMSLQTTLNMTNCKVGAGLATGYFGDLTVAAVKCFQAANGLAADGVVGMNTGAKLGLVVAGPAGNPNQPGCPAGALFNSLTGAPCTGNTGGNTGGTLSGTDGTIADVNELSQYSNEDVGEGQDDVKVAAFEVETSNDGDIRISSAKISFSVSNTSGSDNLDDYIDGVTIWMGDEEVASVDVDDFNEDSDGAYSKTIALSDAVVRADDIEKFYISVDAVGSFDSGDIDSETVTVDVENLRFVDGSGVTTTETGYDLDGMDVAISFVDFATAADIDLNISKASDSPDAGIVIVDDASETSDVVLLKGELELDGDSDVTIDEFPVSFSPVGDYITNIASTVTLVLDGEEYTESVSSVAYDGSTGTITFDNLDFEMSAGDTVDFEILADINGTDDYAEGDTLTASVTASNRAMMDVEDENGDDVDDSDRSGTATGEAQEFRSEGLSVELVSTSETSSGDSDQIATFKIKFKVAAIGSDVYVSSLAAASLTTTGTGTVVGVERAGTATVGGVTVTITNTTDDDLTDVGNYMISEGDEETFEVVVTASLPAAGADGQFRALIRAIDWDTDDDATPDQSYTSNLDSFKTSYIALQ